MGDFVAYNCPSRVALLALLAAVLIVAGLWMGGAFGSPPTSPRYSEEYTFALGWFLVVYFSFFGVVAVRKLFDTSAQLQIGPSGIRWAPWSDKTIPWSEITDVTSRRYGWRKMIVLHLRHPAFFPGRWSAAMLDSPWWTTSRFDICINLISTDCSYDEAMSAIARFRR